jgi:hypothetical protein
MNALINPSVASIQGAWAAVRLNDHGYAHIDGSAPGFRRSWAALLLGLPFLALAAFAVSKMTMAEPKLPDVPVYAAFAGAILQWILGAGCLALIALVFGKADRIKRLIACDNWISLWFLVLEAPFHFMNAIGILAPLGSLGSSLISVFAMVVGARMLLVVLELPVAAVIGIILFLLLIQLSMVQLLQGLVG